VIHIDSATGGSTGENVNITLAKSEDITENPEDKGMVDIAMPTPSRDQSIILRVKIEEMQKVLRFLNDEFEL